MKLMFFCSADSESRTDLPDFAVLTWAPLSGVFTLLSLFWKIQSAAADTPTFIPCFTV